MAPGISCFLQTTCLQCRCGPADLPDEHHTKIIRPGTSPTPQNNSYGQISWALLCLTLFFVYVIMNFLLALIRKSKEMSPEAHKPISHYCPIGFKKETWRKWFQEFTGVIISFDCFYQFLHTILKAIAPGASRPNSYYFSVSFDQQMVPGTPSNTSY